MDGNADGGSTIRLEDAGIPDVAELQEVFDGAADYFRRITGKPAPDPDAALRELKSAAATEGREVALVRLADGGRAVGSVGWWAGSPEPDVALLGMLLVEEASRGRGYAREALRALEVRLRENGIGRLRTGVGAEDREAHAVLAALGFSSLDQRAHVDMDGGRLRIAFFEKEI